MAQIGNFRDPLEGVMPRLGPPVQNVGGIGGAQTAPLAQRPVAAPAVQAGPPGPSPAQQNLGTMQTAIQGVVNPPKPVAPAAPVPLPAPVPQVPGASSTAATSMTYGSQGGLSPGTSTSLEDSIRQYISGASGGVTSKAFIDRAKNQLGSAVEGQREVGARRINDDAVRRGLFKSGIPAEGIAAGEVGAKNALSSGIADILSNAEKQDIAGRESAAGVAGNLLSSNRSWDQWQQSRADDQAAQAAARAGAGQKEDTTFTYIDPDTGQSYQMDEQWF